MSQYICRDFLGSAHPMTAHMLVRFMHGRSRYVALSFTYVLQEQPLFSSASETFVELSCYP
jgi:hypothetical protein